MDRLGIILINVTSFYIGPQLVELSECRPSFLLGYLTVFVPNAVGAVLALRGSRGPLLFVGTVLASICTTVFWASYDTKLALYSCTALLLYAIGLGLHTFQSEVPAAVWGNHEWAHLFISCGLAVNVMASLYMHERCSSARAL
jgi:hypothetical protein